MAALTKGEAAWSYASMIIVAIVTAILLQFAIRVWRLVTRKLPPGPKGNWLTGTNWYFKNPTRAYLDYTRLWKDYGEVASFYAARRLVVVFNSHKVVKDAFLKRGTDFADRNPDYLGDMYYHAQDEVFLCPYDEDWKEKKRFSIRAVKQAGFGTRASEDKIIYELNEFLDYIDKQNGKPVDICESLALMMCNVASNTLFSKRYPWGHSEHTRLLQAGREFYEVVDGATASYYLNLAMYLPVWLIRLIHPQYCKKLATGMGTVRSYIRERISEHRETFDPDNIRDFLDMYLLTRCVDPKFTEDIFISTMAIFVPDGIDTLSASASWIILHLGYHPEEQEKARQQVQAVCGDRAPTLNDRSKLPYVEACIWEGLRLGSALPLSLAHVPYQATTYDGYDIPKDNTVAVANFYAANRDPDVFPDPDEYKPSRFIGEKGKLKGTADVFTFGLGPRSCPASQMARVELFLIFSHLFQRYKIQFPNDRPSPTLEPDHGSLFRGTTPFQIQLVARQ